VLCPHITYTTSSERLARMDGVHSEELFFALQVLHIFILVGDHALVFTVLGLIAISGAEAMFADLGHFSKLSLRVHLIFFNMDMSFVIEVFESIFTMTFFIALSWQLGFTIIVYPCLVLAYMGEAAYLSKHREDLQSSFYKALPGEVPCFDKLMEVLNLFYYKNVSQIIILYFYIAKYAFPPLHLTCMYQGFFFLSSFFFTGGDWNIRFQSNTGILDNLPPKFILMIFN
jgi:hypothetical protein